MLVSYLTSQFLTVDCQRANHHLNLLEWSDQPDIGPYYEQFRFGRFDLHVNSCTLKAAVQLLVGLLMTNLPYSFS